MGPSVWTSASGCMEVRAHWSPCGFLPLLPAYEPGDRLAASTADGLQRAHRSHPEQPELRGYVSVKWSMANLDWAALNPVETIARRGEELLFSCCLEWDRSLFTCVCERERERDWERVNEMESGSWYLKTFFSRARLHAFSAEPLVWAKDIDKCAFIEHAPQVSNLCRVWENWHDEARNEGRALCYSLPPAPPLTHFRLLVSVNEMLVELREKTVLSSPSVLLEISPGTHTGITKSNPKSPSTYRAPVMNQKILHTVVPTLMQ
jgi:hypothetical protein